MDILSTVGFSIAGFVVMLVVIFMVGFKIQARDEMIECDTESIEFLQWKDGTPSLMIKHYESIYGMSGMPVIKTVHLKGAAKYKISNLWMPVKYHTWIDHDSGFLRELDFFWYGKVILKGLDFWIKGVGALQVNGVIRMNEIGMNVTESQWVSYWAENILTATCDFSYDQLKWETANKYSLVLLLPQLGDQSNERHKININFASDTERINSISALRYRGNTEIKRMPWTLIVKKWEKHHGIWMPEYHVQWEDQKKPWCKFTIRGLFINTGQEAVRDKINEIPLRKYKTGIATRNKKRKTKTIE